MSEGRRARRALPLALLVASASACAAAPRPRALAVPPPPGFHQAGAHVSHWKGRVCVGEVSRRFRLAVLAAPRARFRLEISTPVGALVLQAAHDGERIRIVIPRERVYFDEDASAATVERLLGLPLSPERLVAIMVGRAAPPAFPPEEGATTAAAATSGAPDAGHASARLAAGGEEVEVHYGALVEAASGRLPETVTLSWASAPRPVEVELVLRSARPVAAPARDALRLAVPQRFRRARLADIREEGPLLVPAAGEDDEVEEPIAP